MVAGHKEKRNIISIFDTWKTKEPESQTSREKAGIAACMFVHFQVHEATVSMTVKL